MWPFHPTAKFPDLPLLENEKIVNPKVTPADQRNLTTWYTEHAVDFIGRNKERPFFLYVAHNMPHVPLHVSDKFKGKSKQGLYGDVIIFTVSLALLARNSLGYNLLSVNGSR
jgi:arylsulfatase A